jgi:uncharacterized GH25 family protein
VKRILVLALACALPGSAAAHEFWLAPSKYRAAAGDTISVAAFAGTGFRGERKPYAATRSLRFTLHGAKDFDLRPLATNGDLTMARFIAADGGGAMVAYQSDFVPIELPAVEFDRYLELEGLDAPLHVRARLAGAAGPGRERYARCPKTWIAGTQSGRALSPSGLPLEIVPLADPEFSFPLRVKVLYRGRPLAGTLVRAWNQPLDREGLPRDAAARDSVGPAAQVRSDRNGLATLSLERSGEWLVGAVHMVPSTNRAVADWESLWASLTFARGSRP